MTAETGDTPILLLDDIIQNLTSEGAATSSSTIGDQQYQALITAADLAGFDPTFLEHSTLLEVNQGELQRGRPTQTDRRQSEAEESPLATGKRRCKDTRPESTGKCLVQHAGTGRRAIDCPSL